LAYRATTRTSGMTERRAKTSLTVASCDPRNGHLRRVCPGTAFLAQITRPNGDVVPGPVYKAGSAARLSVVVRNRLWGDSRVEPEQISNPASVSSFSDDASMRIFSFEAGIYQALYVRAVGAVETGNLSAVPAPTGRALRVPSRKRRPGQAAKNSSPAEVDDLRRRPAVVLTIAPFRAIGRRRSSRGGSRLQR